MLYNLINKSIKNNLLGKIGISYENMYETTVIMLSKAKQSKAKQSHNCILSNNFKFYISQFFKTFKLISFNQYFLNSKANLSFKVCSDHYCVKNKFIYFGV